nr:MAG TPA: tail completion protein [Caudoviricetes sp.]
MTAENVAKMLEEMKLPFAYHHFAEGESPDPPFLVYLYPGADNFAADGVTYFKVNKLHIELYTDYKDVDLEEKVEAVLIGHGLFYDKSEVWISSEKLYEVLYQMEV